MEVRLEIKYRSFYRVINTAFHFIGAVHFVLAVYFFFEYKHKTEVTYYDRFGWSFKYLAFWSVLINTAYFGFSWIVDIVKYTSYTRDAPPWMMDVQSYIKTCLAVPFSCSTSVCFWIFFLSDPRTLFKEGQKPPEMWLVHMSTTNAVLFVIVDSIICRSDYPNLILSAVVILVIFIMYFVWMLIVKLVTGVWIIDLFGRMTFVKKIVTFIACYMVLMAFYFLGRLFNKVLWDEQVRRTMRVGTEDFILKKVLSHEMHKN